MLSDDDRSWIAENILRGGDPADMRRALTRAGRDPAAVQAELDAALRHPYLAGAQRVRDVQDRRLRKAYWVLDSLTKTSRLAGASAAVPVEEDLDAERFYRAYYAANRPVLIRNAFRDWAALHLWTPDYLRQRWGDSIVEVQAQRNDSHQFETRAEKHTQSMRFGDFIHLVQAGPTNDIYMTARNSESNRLALPGLWEDIGDIARYLAPTLPRSGFFWFGPRGTKTPNHHDLTNNMMAQVLGRKRITLADARTLPHIYNHLHVFSNVDLAVVDAQRFPNMRNVEILSVDIGPGDLLFLPVGWWHQVEALDISITMTFTNFQADNEFSSFYRSNGEM